MKIKFIKILLGVVLLGLAIPIMHLIRTKLSEDAHRPVVPHGYANDASGLNLTKVDTIIPVPSTQAEIVAQLREVLSYAKAHDLKISMAGARHSMGGHTIYPNGIVVNMLPYKHMSFDTASNILTVGAGALWEDALRYLDGYGKSIAIMQAFSSFSIGGSMSVNGHGWQKNLPPIAASVQSFTLMNHNGEIINCSRQENTELFRLVIGGYGLFGIILDVKLQVVDNAALQYHYMRMNTKDYVSNYKKYVTDNPNVDLVFGRLRISDHQFLEEATLSYFEKVQAPIPVLSKEKPTEAKRLIFRSGVDSEFGKRLRWMMEKGANRKTENDVYSRNELLNDPVSLIENRDSSTTDLLHEYFIPERNFNQFIEQIKPVLQSSSVDLLNITIRAVAKDEDSFLAFARESVFGFVLLFNQKKTYEQEKAMKELTNQLVDVTLANEGTFYLPYRLHPDRERMRLSYPQANDFFERKLAYDPQELFNNQFYQHYK